MKSFLSQYGRPRVPVMRRVGLSLALMFGLLACSQKPQEPSTHNDVKLISHALATIHQRYIDEQAVSVDLLISNSLAGMITAIDPHAQLVHLRDAPPATTLSAADLPLIETSQFENPSLLIIRIFAFEPGLLRQLREHEPALRRLAPQGILLDVRGSYGQDYRAAAELSEWFLPIDTVIGALIEKQGAPPVPFASNRAPLWDRIPVVMLIDSKTTGPAEWAAAALRFFDRVRLVGEPSGGLAMLQSTLPLSEEWGLRISTGRALNPDGRPITGNPLTPDVLAQPVPDTENIDWIYQQGIATLKGLL